MLRQEQELAKIRHITAEIEKELSKHLEENQSGTTQKDTKKNKIQAQQEKKRKKEKDKKKKRRKKKWMLKMGKKYLLSPKLVNYIIKQ